MTINTGKLLLSEPFLTDPNFKRSAIVLTDYDVEHGTVGFVLNQISPYRLEELLDDIGEFSSEVFIGGPVANNVLHFLHNVGDMLEESIPVCRGLYWGGDFTSMKFLLKHDVIKPENIRFFLGYSGWSAGQLEDEIAEGTWIIEDMDSNYLFKNNPETLWKTVLQAKGETYSAISQMDGDHIFN